MSSDYHFKSGTLTDTPFLSDQILTDTRHNHSKSLVISEHRYLPSSDPYSYLYASNDSQNKSFTSKSYIFQDILSENSNLGNSFCDKKDSSIQAFYSSNLTENINKGYLAKTMPPINTNREQNQQGKSPFYNNASPPFTDCANQDTPCFPDEKDILRSLHSSLEHNLSLSSGHERLLEYPSTNHYNQTKESKDITNYALKGAILSTLEDRSQYHEQTDFNVLAENRKSVAEMIEIANKILKIESNQGPTETVICSPSLILGKGDKGTPASPTETTAASLESIKDEYIMSDKNIQANLDINTQLIKKLKESVSKYRNESNIAVGLKNSGLSCYINVILHCLLNAPLFAHYFLELYHEEERNPKSRGIISYIFGKMLDILSKHDNILNNNDVKDDLNESSAFLRLHTTWALNPSFKRRVQNDSIEFLKMLLGAMSEELNRVTDRPPYQTLSTALSPNESLQTKSQEWFSSVLERENSIVTDLFGGQLLNTQLCHRCKSKKVSFDLFWDLSLAFNQTNNGLHTLEDLLRNYLREETLNDQTSNCQTCYSPMVLKTQIWRLPEILVFTFKRFRGDGVWHKIEDNVAFPVNNLNLGPFIEESCDKSVLDARYTLFGIVKHMGTLDSGHYTAECLNLFNQKWYRINDDYVEESNLAKETVFSIGEPSILFYIKSSSAQL